MIDPKLLTRDNGFEDGVVVELIWRNDSPDVDIRWRRETGYWDDAKEWSTNFMESIRPLTGPMSVWNHAPGRAKSVIVTDLGDIIWYEDGDPGIEMIGVVFHGNRPFWATREDAKGAER